MTPRLGQTSVTLPTELIDRITHVLPPGGNVTSFLTRWAEFGIRADATTDLSGLLRTLAEHARGS